MAIRHNHYDLTKEIIGNSFSDMIFVSYNDFSVIEILKNMIEKFERKAEELIYHVIYNTNYKFTIDSLLIVLNFSLTYRNPSNNIFYNLVNYIVSTYKNIVVRGLFIGTNIQKILYKYIYEHNYPDCLLFINIMVTYNPSYLNDFYSVIYFLYDYYRNHRGIHINKLFPQKDYMFSLCNILEHIYLLDGEYNRLLKSSISTMLLYFLGSYKYLDKFSHREIYEHCVKTKVHQFNIERCDRDYVRLLNYNIKDMFLEIEKRNYRLNIKDCIKISVDFNDIQLLKYFVNKI